MSCEEETAELLRQAGHKVTPQRLMIIRVLRHAQGHLTAAQIAEEVRVQYPMVDVSTVYRTLEVLRRMRLATSTDMGTGDAVFEWAPQEPHHHLVCSVCGYVQSLGHEYLEQLDARIRRELRFAPDLDHFAIFGVCAECQAREDGDADTA